MVEKVKEGEKKKQKTHPKYRDFRVIRITHAFALFRVFIAILLVFEVETVIAMISAMLGRKATR